MALLGYDSKDSKYAEITSKNTFSGSVSAGSVSERPTYIKSSYAQPLQSEGVNQMSTQYVRTFTDKKNVMEYSTVRDRTIGISQTNGFMDRPNFNVYPNSRKEANVHNQHFDRTIKCDPSENSLCGQAYTERFPTKTL